MKMIGHQAICQNISKVIKIEFQPLDKIFIIAVRKENGAFIDSTVIDMIKMVW